LLGWAALACWRYHSYMPSPFIGSTSNSLNAQNKASTPVRRIPHRDPIDVRGKICHLVFELREGANVIGAALLVGMIKLLIRARRFNAALAGGGATPFSRSVTARLTAKLPPPALASKRTIGSSSVGAAIQLDGMLGVGPCGGIEENAATRRFCGECGTPLPLPCVRLREESRVELKHSTPHRFVREVEPPLGYQFLNIAVAQREAEIEPNCVLADLGREAMTAIAEQSHADILPDTPLTPAQFP